MISKAKQIIVALFLVSAGTVHAAEWVEVADAVWMQKGSVVADAEIVGALVRIRIKGKYEFFRFALREESCANGYGLMAMSNIYFENSIQVDYVENGGTIASRVGDVLCALKKVMNNADGV